MKKIINICIAIAGVALAAVWLNLVITREFVPTLIIIALCATIVWFGWQWYVWHKAKRNGFNAKEKPARLFSQNLENLVNYCFNAEVFAPSNTGNSRLYVKLSAAEAYQGCVKPLFYIIHKYCEDCAGTGIGEGGSSAPCKACDASGVLKTVTKILFVPLTTMVPCKYCSGIGAIIQNPCQRCSGKGYYETSDRCDMVVPAYFSEESIIIPDKGHYTAKDTREHLVVILNIKR